MTKDCLVKRYTGLKKEDFIQSVKKNSTAFYYERAKELKCSVSTVIRAFKEFGITRKKVKFYHPNYDPIQALLFILMLIMYQHECLKTIYIDESGFTKSSPRRYGYDLKGDTPTVEHDSAERNVYNVLGALHEGKLIAVAYCKKPINGPTFHYWVENFLLNSIPENSLIVLDNARFHKLKETVELIESAGHVVLWLPPYSPQLNPIEQVWAHIKCHRRVNKTKELESIIPFIHKSERHLFCMKKSEIKRIEKKKA